MWTSSRTIFVKLNYNANYFYEINTKSNILNKKTNVINKICFLYYLHKKKLFRVLSMCVYSTIRFHIRISLHKFQIFQILNRWTSRFRRWWHSRRFYKRHYLNMFGSLLHSFSFDFLSFNPQVKYEHLFAYTMVSVYALHASTSGFNSTIWKIFYSKLWEIIWNYKINRIPIWKREIDRVKKERKTERERKGNNETLK